jgi:PqqD family protein of HPr-rel-A system
MAADKIASDVRYSGVAPDDVRLVDLGVITACYHRASAQTHLLMEPSPEIMAHLWGRTLSLADITAALSAEFEVAADAGSDFADTLSARLQELCAIGLVAVTSDSGDA